jgi:hypothetical protein
VPKWRITVPTGTGVSRPEPASRRG